MVSRYLSIERPELLGGAEDDAVWVSWGGRAMSQKMVQKRARVRTEAEFGIAFGTHRFRSSLTTKIALEGYDSPLDAAAILAHVVVVSIKHYNRASTTRAARRHADRIDALRRALRRCVRRDNGPTIQPEQYLAYILHTFRSLSTNAAFLLPKDSFTICMLQTFSSCELPPRYLL
jgi:hypothetical protein